MKIQIPDGKHEDEPSTEQTPLEESKPKQIAIAGNPSINKLICCCLFGMMYIIAVLTVDDAVRSDFLSRGYVDTFPYTLRLMIGSAMLFVCMYGAMSVLIQKPMFAQRFVSVMFLTEVARLLTYTYDYLSNLSLNNYTCDLNVLVLTVRSGLEITCALMFYKKVVAPASRAAAIMRQQAAIAKTGAATTVATPPAPAAQTAVVEIPVEQPSEVPSIPPGAIAHL